MDRQVRQRVLQQVGETVGAGFGEQRATPVQLARRRRASSVTSLTPAADRSAHVAAADRRVHLPGVGWMNNRQLMALEGVLLRDAIPDDISDLPDLSGMTSEQLALLESRLRNMSGSVPDVTEHHEVRSETADLPHAGRVRHSSSRPMSGEGGQTTPASLPSWSRREAEMSQPQRMHIGTPPRLFERNSQHSHQQDHQHSELGTTLESHQHHRHRDLDAAMALLLMGGAMSPGLGRLLTTPSQPGAHSASGDTETSKSGSWQVTNNALLQIKMRGKSAPQGQECAICYLPIDDDPAALPCLKKGCASFFCVECIRPWLEKNPSCPLCRADCKNLVQHVAPEINDSDEESGDEFPLAAFILSHATSEPQLRRVGPDLEFTGQGSMSMHDVQALRMAHRDRLAPIQHHGLRDLGPDRSQRQLRPRGLVPARAALPGEAAHQDFGRGGPARFDQDASMPSLMQEPSEPFQETALHERRQSLLAAYNQGPWHHPASHSGFRGENTGRTLRVRHGWYC